jgi:hypothetical protein
MISGPFALPCDFEDYGRIAIEGTVPLPEKLPASFFAFPSPSNADILSVALSYT